MSSERYIVRPWAHGIEVKFFAFDTIRSCYIGNGYLERYLAQEAVNGLNRVIETAKRVSDDIAP